MKLASLAALVFTFILTGCDTPLPTPDKPDFASITDIKEKKSAFFNYLYPLIKQANNEVSLEQKKFQTLGQQSQALSLAQVSSIKKTAKTYKVKCETAGKACATAISNKIGMIPPSLILAQAANESAWGTSRFAVEGNNFFGQWCFKKGCGLTPADRNTGASHEVRKFDSALDSVKSYIHNLNTSSSYKALRQLRKTALQQNKQPSGIMLAAGLLKYSERGEEYVKEIRSMISYNNLQDFDDVFWQALSQAEDSSL